MGEATEKSSSRGSGFLRNHLDGFAGFQIRKRIQYIYSNKFPSKRVFKDKLGRLKNKKLIFVEARTLKEMCPDAMGKKTVSLKEQIANGKYGRVFIAVENGKQKQKKIQEVVETNTNANTNSNSVRKFPHFIPKLKVSDLKLKSISTSAINSKAKLSKRHSNGNKDHSCESNPDKKMYAVKRIRIGKKGTRASPELVREELELITELQSCPYIVRYYGCYLNYFPSQELCLIMEYANNGDARRIISDPSTQMQQQCVAASVLLALDHMHSRGYVHKDIKPENMLLVDDITDERMIVKLCDFGASERYDDGSPLRHWYGTMQYLSPEYLEYCLCKDFALDHNKPDDWGVSKNPKYFQNFCTDRMDIWALGIFMLEILLKTSSSKKMNRPKLTSVIRKLFRDEGKESALDVLFFREDETTSSIPSPIQDDGGEPPPVEIQGDDGEIVSSPSVEILGDDGQIITSAVAEGRANDGEITSPSVEEIQFDNNGYIAAVSTPVNEVQFDGNGYIVACPQIEYTGKVQSKQMLKQIKYKEQKNKTNKQKTYSDAELEVGLWKPHSRKIVKENAAMVDFISKCLVLNPVKRWSADHLLKHPYVESMARKLSANM